MDMAWYLRSTASNDHILCKLLVIIGIVALYDILMQISYKVSQGNNEKVPSFATRLEGTLNQIQFQCPRRMVDIEAQQLLMDCLFCRVRKHICNSIWYLYNAPGVSYLQLMVATQKAESENEETQDQVNTKATIAIEPVEGDTKLNQQIAQLMAALTQVA